MPTFEHGGGAKRPRPKVAESRPVTNEDLKAAFEAKKKRAAKRNELVSDASAPFVFAPRHMWRKKKT